MVNQIEETMKVLFPETKSTPKKKKGEIKKEDVEKVITFIKANP